MTTQQPLTPYQSQYVAWRVTHQHLREFLIANPLEWTPARVDRFWLIDILAGRVGARSNG